MFQLIRYLTVNDAESSFSFLKQPSQKTHPVVAEKMFICFRKVKLLAKITSNEIAETNSVKELFNAKL